MSLAPREREILANALPCHACGRRGPGDYRVEVWDDRDVGGFWRVVDRLGLEQCKFSDEEVREIQARCESRGELCGQFDNLGRPFRKVGTVERVAYQPFATGRDMVERREITEEDMQTLRNSWGSR